MPRPSALALLLLLLPVLDPSVAAAQQLRVEPGRIGLRARGTDPVTIDVTLSNPGRDTLVYQLSTLPGGGSEAATRAAMMRTAATRAGTRRHATSAPRGLENAPGDLVAVRVAGDPGVASKSGSPGERYAWDDGTSNANFGTNAANDLMWMNGFDAAAGGDTIRAVSVAWGIPGAPSRSVADGRRATVLLYDDPDDDGDPSDAVLLTSSEVRVIAADTDRFTRVDLEATAVEGAFFVAVLMEKKAAGTYPAAYDIDDAVEDRAWYVVAEPGRMDVETLAANRTPPSKVPVFRGNWLVRADVDRPAFVRPGRAHGVVAPGGAQTIAVTLDPGQLASGEHEARLLVTSNDPADFRTTIPLTVVAEGTATSAEEAPVPDGPVLASNHPNPFDLRTVISYTVPAAGHVTLRVFDAAGRAVATLVDAWRPAGDHRAGFEAAGLPSGVYVVRIDAGSFTAARTMMLVR